MRTTPTSPVLGNPGSQPRKHCTAMFTNGSDLRDSAGNQPDRDSAMSGLQTIQYTKYLHSLRLEHIRVDRSGLLISMGKYVDEEKSRFLASLKFAHVT